MAIAHTQCPNCHQLVPVGAHACPHCGVYLQLPDQPHTPPQIAQTPVPGPLSPIALETALPDAIKQLDATATTNTTISGVLIAFYSGAIFAGKVQASEPVHAVVYTLPVVLLLVTIILSVRAFYSTGYLTDDYPTLLKKKSERLRYSSLLLEISVALLAISVFVYLQRAIS